jgi:hypothetical protein
MPLDVLPGVDDNYVYRVEEGKEAKVCLHMANVYNEHFRRPWDLDDYPVKTPPFPRLPGVEYDELHALTLRFSAFPTSPEFEAVRWHEGRLVTDPKSDRSRPMLVARTDIDNDGKPDILVKSAFMRNFSQGVRSVAGGEDFIVILPNDQPQLPARIARSELYGSPGKDGAVLVSYSTLGFPARSIRPFIYEGITYLAVYEQRLESEQSRSAVYEWMWILKYHAGGWNRGGGWEPLKVDRVCRLRMVVSK